MYDRLPAASRSRYLKWFERFDTAAKARLYLPRNENEAGYAKKVAPGDLEVELIELALQVEKEVRGEGPEQERRTLSLEELDLEQQKLSESEQEEQQERCEPKQVCEERNLSDSERKGDDPWIEAIRRLKQEKEERMKGWGKSIQKALFEEPRVYYDSSDWDN